MRLFIEQSASTAGGALHMEALQIPDDCIEMCHRMLSRGIMMEQYLDYVKLSVNVH